GVPSGPPADEPGLPDDAPGPQRGALIPWRDTPAVRHAALIPRRDTPGLRRDTPAAPSTPAALAARSGRPRDTPVAPLRLTTRGRVPSRDKPPDIRNPRDPRHSRRRGSRHGVKSRHAGTQPAPARRPGFPRPTLAPACLGPSGGLR